MSFVYRGDDGRTARVIKGPATRGEARRGEARRGEAHRFGELTLAAYGL